MLYRSISCYLDRLNLTISSFKPYVSRLKCLRTSLVINFMSSSSRINNEVQEMVVYTLLYS